MTAKQIYVIIFVLIFPLYCNADKIPYQEIDGRIVLHGKWGNGPGEFGFKCEQGELPEGPTDFTVDNDGNLYVVDRLNQRIQKFDKNGDLTRIFNFSGREVIPYMRYIAVMKNQMYLSGGRKVYVIDSLGMLLHTIPMDKDIKRVMSGENETFYICIRRRYYTWYKYSPSFEAIDSFYASETGLAIVDNKLFIKSNYPKQGEKIIINIDGVDKSLVYYDDRKEMQQSITSDEINASYLLIGASNDTGVYINSHSKVWKIDHEGYIQGKISMNNLHDLLCGVLPEMTYNTKAIGNKVYIADGTEKEFRIVMFEFPTE